MAQRKEEAAAVAALQMHKHSLILFQCQLRTLNAEAAATYPNALTQPQPSQPADMEKRATRRLVCVCESELRHVTVAVIDRQHGNRHTEYLLVG